MVCIKCQDNECNIETICGHIYCRKCIRENDVCIECGSFLSDVYGFNESEESIIKIGRAHV